MKKKFLVRRILKTFNLVQREFPFCADGRKRNSDWDQGEILLERRLTALNPKVIIVVEHAIDKHEVVFPSV